MGDDDWTIERFQEALREAPNHHELRLQLAEALLKQGDVEAAVVEGLMVLRIWPDHNEALQFLEGALADTDLGRSEAYGRLWRGLEALDGHRELSRHPSEDDLDDDEDDELDAPVVTLRMLEGEAEDSIERPRLKLRDVKGLQRVKRAIAAEVIAISANSAADGAEPTAHDGLLIYGPPNCGKTFLSKVAASELGGAFVTIDVSDLLEHWSAWGERRLRETFRLAERNQPAIVFLDNLDVLHRTSEDGGRDALTHEIGSLLEKLSASKQAVGVIAAATIPWFVPASLVRAGRLGRVLLVLPPDKPARDAILRQRMKKMRIDDSVDVAWLAQHTDGYSASELHRLIDTAADLASHDGPHAGVTMAHCKHALNLMRPSSAGWISTAANHALVAEGTGLYDDLLDYLRLRGRPTHTPLG